MKQCFTIALAVATLLFGTVSTEAQDRPMVPWRYGAHLGLNFNMAGVGYSDWLAIPSRPGGSFIPHVLNDGSGLGLYGGLNLQYMFERWIGLQGRLSYDNRSLTALDDQTHKNPDGSAIEDEFTFHLGLINLEALLKLYVGESFHFTGGGGVGFKVADTWDYRLDSQDPAVTDNPIEGAVAVFSFAGGLGYDIPLSDPNETTQWFLTPFLEATYMVGLKEVQFDSQNGFADGLSIVTIRAGLNLAFGDAVISDATGAAAPAKKLFRISPPEDGIYTTRVVEEYLPLRPHVFFDKGSTEIPARYHKISSSDTAEAVAGFLNKWSAEDLKDVEARQYRQGEVYYNILNIVGYRMKNQTTSNVTFIGSDPNEKNGEALAESAKKYVVDTWGVPSDRITVKGQENPRIPSGTARTPAADRPLTEIENRRVEIVSDDPNMMRRVILKRQREAKDENEVYTELITDENVVSWQATISGNGQRKSYGPFSENEAYLDPTGLLTGSQDSARYTIEVIAKTEDGRTLSESEQFTLKMNKGNAQAQRHTLTFEYSEDDPVKKSQEFIDNIVNTIPTGSTIIISGFTDNIGTEEANKKLSQDRANTVKDMLQKKLNSSGKKATIRSAGYGENSERAPFTNDVPEGRMYNRTVVVDVFP